MLVAYSDSEGSDDDTPKINSKPALQNKNNFTTDKSNPRKIHVNFARPQQHIEQEDGQPPAKRPRVGAGTFSGFNSMLPAPKRTSESANNGSATSKSARRKVFSLKTGAEPAFSRESDAELKQMFTEQHFVPEDNFETEAANPAFISNEKQSVQIQGKPLMFKPLSVARNNKRKTKKNADQIAVPGMTQAQVLPISTANSTATQEQTPRKINLFSSGPTILPQDVEDIQDIAEEDEIIEGLNDKESYPPQSAFNTGLTQPADSLNSIVEGLNLSAAERRQLFGRGSQGSDGKIITFNTDAEYAANQARLASGEQVQHNPVRSIAPGKHSLKSLVASAADQKDALEESFASGKKNKREAGSRYGW